MNSRFDTGLRDAQAVEALNDVVRRLVVAFDLSAPPVPLPCPACKLFTKPRSSSAWTARSARVAASMRSASI